MDRAFYQQILGDDPSLIFEDEEHIIWIDWREEEDAIVEALCEKIEIDELTASIQNADNDQGYVVLIGCRGKHDRSIQTVSHTSIHCSTYHRWPNANRLRFRWPVFQLTTQEVTLIEQVK